MGRISLRPVLGALLALALVSGAVGPCHCLLGVAECHRQTQEDEAHGCCEKPAGVQAVADTCCDEGGEPLVAATQSLPEVAPPSLQAGPAGPSLPVERSASVPAVRALAPASLDRTTVLLI